MVRQRRATAAYAIALLNSAGMWRDISSLRLSIRWRALTELLTPSTPGAFRQVFLRALTYLNLDATGVLPVSGAIFSGFRFPAAPLKGPHLSGFALVSCSASRLPSRFLMHSPDPWPARASARSASRSNTASTGRPIVVRDASSLGAIASLSDGVQLHHKGCRSAARGSGALRTRALPDRSKWGNSLLMATSLCGANFSASESPATGVVHGHCLQASPVVIAHTAH